ncbi:MAG TPA: hypothetical protein VHM94_15595 [Acidimicrobiia bacterium]|nr:hypothetical protein [Acidimicrobiia bacterium]
MTAVAACGGGSASITSVAPAASSSGPTSSTSPPATSLGGNNGDSVLQRRDVPPEAVLAQSELSLQGENPIEDMLEVVPRSGPPGTRFVVSLVGSQPESELEIHLYWADPGGDVVDSESYFLGYGYVTSLRLMTDESGNATLDLVTEPSDPVGGYCLFSESPQLDEYQCEAFFLLVSPTE